MKINTSELYNEKCTDVVILAMISISRSIENFPFPSVMTDDGEALQVIEMIGDSFSSFEDKDNYKKISIDTLDLLTKKILEETNIIPSRFNEKIKKELIIKDDNSLAILLNFNEHITIRSRSFGFLIKDICQQAFKVEEHFASCMPFSFDNELGYIVSDIFYFGTAFFQSALLSLPGIVMMGQLGNIVQDLRKTGIAANGYYSPNASASMGWVYYVYSDNSIGKNEEEQIFHFSNSVLRLIYIERELRLQLYLKSKMKITDMIAKAVAIAKYAKLLDVDEAMDVTFKIKLGLELGKTIGTTHEECNAIFHKAQIAHIAYSILNSSFKSLSDELIKAERAKLINQFAKKVQLL